MTELNNGKAKEYEELHNFLLEHSYYDMTKKQRDRHDELKEILSN